MPVVDKPTFPCFPSDGLSSEIVSAHSDLPRLTPEASEVISIVLEQLEGFPGPQKGALLVPDSAGSDRTDLLRCLGRLLENPDSPQWMPLLASLNLSADVRPESPINSLFIQIPTDTSIDLRSFFLESLWQEIPASPAPRDKTADILAGRMLRVSEVLRSQSVGLVVLENFSRRIRLLDNPARFQLEIDTCRMIFEAFSRNGILTVLMGEKQHFHPRQSFLPLEAGESTDRCYSWIECSTPMRRAARSLPIQEEEFQGRLQLLIYDWIQSRIPSWKPERSAMYQHASQALTATLPDGDQGTAGLVYFKSIYDPYWNDEDIARLKAADLPWVLMILSPCERYYEFETKLKELVTHLPILMVWRPDTPSKEELESLRTLAFEILRQSETGAAIEESVARVRLILFDLYIKRGSLIDSASRYLIDIGSKNQGIGRQLSVRLADLSVRKQNPSPKVRTNPSDDSQAYRWAVLLTGNSPLAGKEYLKWLMQFANELPVRAAEFPQEFKTTRFWSRIKSVQGPLGFLNAGPSVINAGSISLFEAIQHLGRTFSWDEERLLNWKHGVEMLGELMKWMPGFIHCREYLEAAFPLGDDSDTLRGTLLQSMQNPELFLEAEARDRFDERFREFKQKYMSAYYMLHENALRIMSVLKKDERKIDFVALRNLELLSGLQYVNKSYLNRVKLLAKWIQRNNCNLPVEEILKVYPRCFCNFNPCTRQRLTGSADDINGIIQDGLGYFRQTLAGCRDLILPEFSGSEAGEEAIRQFAAFLDEGPELPLDPDLIKALQKAIARRPGQFRKQIASHELRGVHRSKIL